MDNQIYPSFILTTATLDLSGVVNDPNILGSGLSTVGIDVIAPTNEAAFRLKISLPGIAETTSFEGKLQKKGQKYSIIPPIRFRYENLVNLRQSSIVSGTFTLYLNGEYAGEKVKPIVVRSVNDIPLWWIRDNGQLMDMPFMVAGFVNEDHPSINQILQEALRTGMINRFAGYQGNQQEVLLQVGAIWNALQRRGVKYSNIPTTSGRDIRVMSQHVRFLSDTIQASQANCLDGSVLFASILRKIGIEPLVVIIPGHAFVGFYTDANRNGSAFLETTLIGNTNLGLFRDERTKNQVSYNAFTAAVTQGNATYNVNVTNFNRNIVGYRVIDIGSLRRTGFRPISR